MLSFCIHHIYMNNRSPAPHTTRGAPNRIARHQRETYNKSLHNTTKARASSCARRNARPHTRSHPARPQTIPHDCPGHRGRHSATCPHAASPIHARGSGAKALAATSSTASRSSSSHRPATRQAGKSWVQTGVLVWQCAQASRSAAQLGFESCGSPVPSRRVLRSARSSSACREAARGRRPPTELAHGVRSAARAARAPAPSRTAALPPLRRPVLPCWRA